MSGNLCASANVNNKNLENLKNCETDADRLIKANAYKLTNKLSTNCNKINVSAATPISVSNLSELTNLSKISAAAQLSQISKLSSLIHPKLEMPTSNHGSSSSAKQESHHGHSAGQGYNPVNCSISEMSPITKPDAEITTLQSVSVNSGGQVGSAKQVSQIGSHGQHMSSQVLGQGMDQLHNSQLGLQGNSHFDQAHMHHLAQMQQHQQPGAHQNLINQQNINVQSQNAMAIDPNTQMGLSFGLQNAVNLTPLTEVQSHAEPSRDPIGAPSSTVEIGGSNVAQQHAALPTSMAGNFMNLQPMHQQQNAQINAQNNQMQLDSNAPGSSLNQSQVNPMLNVNPSTSAQSYLSSIGQLNTTALPGQEAIIENQQAENESQAAGVSNIQVSVEPTQSIPQEQEPANVNVPQNPLEMPPHQNFAHNFAAPFSQTWNGIVNDSKVLAEKL